MKDLFRILRENLEQGNEGVLVTIIASSGSTPRGAGSRMLVTREGIVCGTVGGGAVEHQAEMTARKVLETKNSHIKSFNLTRNQVADIGMVCGGDVTVYFQYVSPEDRKTVALVRKMEQAFQTDEDSWLVLDITDETCWKMGFYHGEDQMEDGEEGFLTLLRKQPEKVFGGSVLQIEAEGRKFYVEPLVRAETVYIFGGGHVAQELVPLLSHVGFSCVVMDDRKEFANPEVFPDARKTIVGDMEKIEEYLHITHRDFVCIMTRGHQFDYYVQKQALAARPAYIGVMGSRNKIKVVTEKLLSDGFTREEIEQCHMPIGTPILADTPAEIAVSIAGELIRTRAERR